MQGEMESTGPSYRGFLWMGSTGTSGDIDPDQAETLCLEKDYVLSPLPETERFQNLINMKQWQCGIFQIADGRGEPFCEVLPYALFFNNMVGIHHWFCTGELNKDGIFHVHALLRTGMRTDSTRRAMTGTFNNLMLTSNYRGLLGTAQASLDCLKLQRCHKPSSMAQYMMKSPIWICSNDDRMLQLAYDITLWRLHERFIPKPEEEAEESADQAEEMNKVSREIVDLIIKCNCKTMQDCMRFGPEIMAKYLHRPGLNSIVTNCLEFVKASGATWNISLFEPYDPYPGAIHKILLHQNIEPSTFDKIFYQWITKADSKKNTICIQGPSNTGKSAFISGLKQCIMWGEITNGNSGFNFEGLLEQNLGIWEEPLMSPELAEKAKQVFEGMVCSIAVKYKKPHMLPRTPIMITTNHDVWRYCQSEEPMFRNRMWIIYFNYQCKDEYYYPRAREHSCECPYCRASRGSETTAGVSSSGTMQSGEQPIFTREQSPGLGTSADVRSGSMPGAGEGPSISYSGASSSTASSSDSKCTSSEQHSSSTVSSNVGHVGSFRIIRPSDSQRRSISQSPMHVESHSSGRRDGDSSSGNGSRAGRKRGLGGNGDSVEQHVLPDSLGSRSSNETQKRVRSKTKKQRVDESMGARVGAIKLPMVVPSKQEWQEYLSYLYHWYG
uniref:Nonstructural protein n=1 Tax=Parvoviridae sp. TaxID=1940570 RepID=A0A7D3QPP5_9VIRU|nr:MAG: nonstructural protein [Parvoviridae sp.]